MCEDVVHRFACLRVTFSEYSEKAKDFDLQEGVGDSGHVMFGAVSRCDQPFEMSDKHRDGLP